MTSSSHVIEVHPHSDLFEESDSDDAFETPPEHFPESTHTSISLSLIKSLGLLEELSDLTTPTNKSYNENTNDVKEDLAQVDEIGQVEAREKEKRDDEEERDEKMEETEEKNEKQVDEMVDKVEEVGRHDECEEESEDEKMEDEKQVDMEDVERVEKMEEVERHEENAKKSKVDSEQMLQLDIEEKSDNEFDRNMDDEGEIKKVDGDIEEESVDFNEAVALTYERNIAVSLCEYQQSLVLYQRACELETRYMEIVGLEKMKENEEIDQEKTEQLDDDITKTEEHDERKKEMESEDEVNEMKKKDDLEIEQREEKDNSQDRELEETDNGKEESVEKPKMKVEEVFTSHVEIITETAPFYDTIETTPTSDKGVNTETTPTKNTTTQTVLEYYDASINTEMSTFDLLQQVYSAEKIERIKEQLKQTMAELNEERSKRMVNDNLLSILEKDVVSLQQRNVNEATTRIRMDSEIADVNVSYIINKPPHCMLIYMNNKPPFGYAFGNICLLGSMVVCTHIL